MHPFLDTESTPKTKSSYVALQEAYQQATGEIARLQAREEASRLQLRGDIDALKNKMTTCNDLFHQYGELRTEYERLRSDNSVLRKLNGVLREGGYEPTVPTEQAWEDLSRTLGV